MSTLLISLMLFAGAPAGPTSIGNVAVVVNWGTKNRLATYDVNGGDAGAAYQYVRQREHDLGDAALFEWEVVWDGSPKAALTTVTLEPTWTYTLPKWTQLSTQPRECQDFWNQNVSEPLRKHEEGHVKVFEDSIDPLVQEIKQLPSGVPAEKVETIIRNYKTRQLAAQKSFHGSTGGVVTSTTTEPPRGCTKLGHIAAKVTHGRDDRSTYRLDCSSLVEAYSELEKRFGGGGHAGPVEIELQVSDKDTMIEPGGTQLVKQITLKVSWRMTLPDWPNLARQPSKCKDAYEKALKQIQEHAERHVEILQSGVKAIEKDLEQMLWAPEADINDIVKRLKKKHVDDEIERYDSSTDRGRSEIEWGIPPGCK